MKPFKKYITEISNYESNDRGEDAYIKAQEAIAATLRDLHGQTHIEHPLAPGSGNKIGLISPVHRITEGGEKVGNSIVGGKVSRFYRWSTWRSGLGALANSMSHQHFIMGSLTGRREGRELPPDEIEFHMNNIHSRHANAISQFRGQHLDLLKDLYHTFQHPVIKRSVDTLKGMGETLENINNMHFNHALNMAALRYQQSLRDNYMENPELHDETQQRLTKTNNQAVVVHGHPLGLMLSGGHNHTEESQYHPTVFEPNPNSNKPGSEWIDVTHKFR